jgi:hydroxymethylbilane synthase
MLFKKIRIGSRASKLALIQSLEVQSLLQKYHLADQSSNLEIEIIPIITSGDKILDRNLAEIGGKGLFIKEIEEALIDGRIDLAVHSAKDVPPFCHQDLEIVAYTKRNDPRDAFISKNYHSFNDLPLGAIIGTSSPRRKSFLLRMRPDLKIVNFRGNINTRLSKINDSEILLGSVLAVAGLNRIKKSENIKQIFNFEEMLPAGGQGSLLIQARKDDHEILALTSMIDDYQTRICVEAERLFLQELKASCNTPVGVHCYIDNSKLILKTAIIDHDGSQIYQTDLQGDLNDYLAIAKQASDKTKSEASSLLKKICQINL